MGANHRDLNPYTWARPRTNKKPAGRLKILWTARRWPCYLVRVDWKALLILLARAALQVLADELDPANRRRPPQEDKAEPKQAPTPTPAETGASQAAPQSAESAGWGPCTEQPAVTVLRIETDQGSTVSPVSFIGDESFAPERVQRERKPGESRRVRRKTQAEEKRAALPRPEYTPEMKAGIERMRARARGLPVVYPQPAAPPRRRAAGAPLAIARLAPATLMLLASGEPMMEAAAAA